MPGALAAKDRRMKVIAGGVEAKLWSKIWILNAVELVLTLVFLLGKILRASIDKLLLPRCVVCLSEHAG